MEQKAFLFIGGVKDGEIIAIQNPTQTIVMPVQVPQSASLGLGEPVQYERHFYTLEELAADKTYFIYRYEKLSHDDVMERLLSNYRPS